MNNLTVSTFLCPFIQFMKFSQQVYWGGLPFSPQKKDLNEVDYYDGVVSHPEPDILECEVKWAFRSTALNKASGCNAIPVELFKG